MKPAFKCPVLNKFVTESGCEYSQQHGHYYCKNCEHHIREIKATQDNHPTKHTKLLVAMITSAMDVFQNGNSWIATKCKRWTRRSYNKSGKLKKSLMRTRKNRTLFWQDMQYCIDTIQDIRDAREWLFSDSTETGSLLWVCEHLKRMAAEHGVNMELDADSLRERLNLNDTKRTVGEGSYCPDSSIQQAGRACAMLG